MLFFKMYIIILYIIITYYTIHIAYCYVYMYNKRTWNHLQLRYLSIHMVFEEHLKIINNILTAVRH